MSARPGRDLSFGIRRAKGWQELGLCRKSLPMRFWKKRQRCTSTSLRVFGQIGEARGLICFRFFCILGRGYSKVGGGHRREIGFPLISRRFRSCSDRTIQFPSFFPGPFKLTWNDCVRLETTKRGFALVKLRNHSASGIILGPSALHLDVFL